MVNMYQEWPQSSHLTQQESYFPNNPFKMGNIIHYQSYSTFGLGVIQNLENKYLIWFGWERTSLPPPRPSDATEAAAKYTSM